MSTGGAHTAETLVSHDRQRSDALVRLVVPSGADRWGRRFGAVGGGGDGTLLGPEGTSALVGRVVFSVIALGNANCHGGGVCVVVWVWLVVC